MIFCRHPGGGVTTRHRGKLDRFPDPNPKDLVPLEGGKEFLEKKNDAFFGKKKIRAEHPEELEDGERRRGSREGA